MKCNSVKYIIVFICINAALFSQTEIPKWHFGIGAGVTSLRLHKGDMFKKADILIAASEKEATIDRMGNHYGWQANTTVSYFLGKHIRLLGGIGITKAQSKAYLETDYVGHFFGFPVNSTTWDTVNLKYLLLDLPVYFRWQIVKEDNPNLVFKFFMDLGLTAELPLVNKSSFSQERSNGDYYFGKLKLDNKVFPFVAIGFMGSDKIGLSLSWTFIGNEKSGEIDFNYNSTLTRLTLNRFF